MRKLTSIIIAAAAMLLADSLRAQEKTVIRFGHFPNITHAQGVIAHAMTRQGKGWFEERLGSNVEIQWFTLQRGTIGDGGDLRRFDRPDLCRAESGAECYFKSNGEEIRIIAGAANGGAALVVKPGGGVEQAG